MKTITFCTSRTAAREFAKTVNGKVQDMGSDSTKGARWGVVHEVQQVTSTVTIACAEHEEAAQALPAREVLKAPSKPKGIKHNSGVLINAKRKQVPVQFKRSTASVATTAALFAMRLK